MPKKISLHPEFKINLKWIALAALIAAGLAALIISGARNNRVAFNAPGSVLSATTTVDPAGVVAEDPTGLTDQSPDGNVSGTSSTSKPAPKPRGQAAVNGTCTYRETQYKTVYREVDWLDQGETQNGTGMNGVEKVCPAADGGSPIVSTVYLPSDKVIYVGTGGEESVSPAQASAYCKAIHGSADSKEYGKCVSDITKD